MGMENWTLWHVGISVKNMDEAVKYFESLGGKADARPAGVLDSTRFKDFETYGKKNVPPWKIKIKWTAPVSRILKHTARRMSRRGRSRSK